MNKLKLPAITTLMVNMTGDYARIAFSGNVNCNASRMSSVTRGVFTGERLNGAILSGREGWAINPSNGGMKMDGRLTLKTDDGALICLTYQGDFSASREAMARMDSGALLRPSEYNFLITAQFSCSHECYKWLNGLIALGTGVQTRTGPIYTLFQTG
jgi:Protein of unknown function (DUF3237)